MISDDSGAIHMRCVDEGKENETEDVEVRRKKKQAKSTELII